MTARSKIEKIDVFFPKPMCRQHPTQQNPRIIIIIDNYNGLDGVNSVNTYMP